MKKKMSLKSVKNVLSRAEMKQLWREVVHAGHQVTLAITIFISVAQLLHAVSGLHQFVPIDNGYLLIFN